MCVAAGSADDAHPVGGGAGVCRYLQTGGGLSHALTWVGSAEFCQCFVRGWFVHHLALTFLCFTA